MCVYYRSSEIGPMSNMRREGLRTEDPLSYSLSHLIFLLFALRHKRGIKGMTDGAEVKKDSNCIFKKFENRGRCDICKSVKCVKV